MDLELGLKTSGYVNLRGRNMPTMSLNTATPIPSLFIIQKKIGTGFFIIDFR